MAQIKYSFLLFVATLLFATLEPIYAQSLPVITGNSLSQYLGKTVTVEGKTWYIDKQQESLGIDVFSLKAEDNSIVYVRTIGSNFPAMGAEYRVTGIPTRENNNIYLVTAPGQFSPLSPQLQAPAQPIQSKNISNTATTVSYPPSFAALWAPTIISTIMALIILLVSYKIWNQRPEQEWGELLVTNGPDRGLSAPLTHKNILLGRGVGTRHDIRFSPGDPTISNRHGQITFQHGNLFYTDMSSNGSWIGGKRLMQGKPTPINSGDMIRIGTAGTVVTVRLRSSHAIQSLFGRVREPALASEKTVMLQTLVEKPDAANTLSNRSANEEQSANNQAAIENNTSLTSGIPLPNQDAEDIAPSMTTPLIFTFSDPTRVSEESEKKETELSIEPLV